MKGIKVAETLTNCYEDLEKGVEDRKIGPRHKLIVLGM